MSALVFKEVQEEDLPVLFALQSQLTKSTLDHASATLRRIKSYPNYKIYLVLVDDRAVATFALMIMDNLGHMCQPIGVIENVVVDEAERGRGIGRRAMQHAIQLCSEAGAYKVMLASHVKLEKAHAFYESLGFQRQGYAFSLDL